MSPGLFRPCCPKRGKSLNKSRKEAQMLWTIVAILVILWLLGLVTSNTMGELIHILLVIAIIVVVVNLIQGRRSI